MSTSVPRPKPWETGSSTESSAGNSDTMASTSQSTTNSTAPDLPQRPTGFGGVAPTTSYGPYGGATGGLNTYNGYGSYGGYNSYSTPYSRFGGGMYGGYGGYGGGYGGYGGGYGGYGGGMFNQPDPNGLQGIQQSTAATFQLIESVVGAVGGFAQMLESTYMATHSSFFAMVSVAEQFGHLKNSLGSILGIFALLRWSKRLIAKITGKQTNDITVKDFAKFASKPPQSTGGSSPSKHSFKPLLFFLAAVFGFPYLLGKLIKSIASQQEQRALMTSTGEALDPSQLEFCRAIYDFIPENPHVELELRKGDLVAILSATDMHGNPSQWWKARTRDGRMGYIPSTYVEKVPRLMPAPTESDKIKPMIEEFNEMNASISSNDDISK